jgi:large subunit ribosomal protein L11
VNIGEIVARINEKTKDYSGMKVPVRISIDSATKQFEILVGSPPTSALIKKELGLEKGTDNPRERLVGNLSMEQVKKIAGMKMDNLSAYSVKSAMKEVIGTCNSLGVTIDGKPAKKVQREIRHGQYASFFERMGEAGTEEISEEEMKKDAMEEEDERAEEEQKKYLEAHPELKAEIEAAEKAEKEKAGGEEKPPEEKKQEEGKEK